MNFGVGGFGGHQSRLAIWHLNVLGLTLGLLGKFTFSRLKVAYWLLRKFHFVKPGIKATICKINNFSIVTSICPKYCCT